MSLACAPLGPTERRIVLLDVLFWHRTKWLVHALAVMPTHVHVLATPLEVGRGGWYSLSEVLHSVKLGSARRINQIRGTRGPVWSVESYDHIVRNEREWQATFDYVLANASEEGLEGDPYAYDGFWCESMAEASTGPPLSGAPSEGEAEAGAHVVPRIPRDSFVRRRRYLPHWETPGASYHVQFGLRGHRVPPSPPAAILRWAARRPPL